MLETVVCLWSMPAVYLHTGQSIKRRSPHRGYNNLVTVKNTLIWAPTQEMLPDAVSTPTYLACLLFRCFRRLCKYCYITVFGYTRVIQPIGV